MLVISNWAVSWQVWYTLDLFLIFNDCTILWARNILKWWWFSLIRIVLKLNNEFKPKNFILRFERSLFWRKKRIVSVWEYLKMSFLNLYYFHFIFVFHLGWFLKFPQLLSLKSKTLLKLLLLIYNQRCCHCRPHSPALVDFRMAIDGIYGENIKDLFYHQWLHCAVVAIVLQ